MEDQLDHPQEQLSTQSNASLTSEDTVTSDRKSKKPLLIIVCCIIILFVLILVLAFVMRQRAHTDVANSQLTSSQNQNISPRRVMVPKTTPVVAAPVSWYTLKTQRYTVSVPQGWTPSAEPFNDGVSLVLRPSNTPGDPLLVVESYNGKVDITSKVQLFEGMGLTKNSVALSSASAVMLSGTWPTRTIDSKTIKTPTQERIIYIPNNGSLNTIRFYYSSAEPNQAYDTILQKVIASFTLIPQ